jgi:hypothetical protein
MKKIKVPNITSECRLQDCIPVIEIQDNSTWPNWVMDHDENQDVIFTWFDNKINYNE